jgi:geranylgeranylglycerol-phosphate geranylgeranyltransferase
MLLQLFCGSIFYFKMNISKKILACFKIIRPLNVLVTFFVVVVAIFISQKTITGFIILILVPLTAALTAAAGNIINDIYDIDTDKISHPKRPLILKTISKKQSWYYYVFLNCLAAVIAATLSTVLLVIVCIVITLLFIYSAYLKRLPLFGNFTIALITGVAFIYGGTAVNNPGAAIIPAIFAFLINFIRELVKDIQDIEGDSNLNYKTFPIISGIDKSNQVILFITALLIGATLYPFLTQLYKIEYFLIIMILVNPLLVLNLKILFDKDDENKYKLASSILKINMIVGLIAIWFGK